MKMKTTSLVLLVRTCDSIKTAFVGPAAHSTPMQQQYKHEPAEREEEGLLQPRHEQERQYEDDEPMVVRTAPHPRHSEAETPKKAPRMKTAPQPVKVFCKLKFRV